MDDLTEAIGQLSTSAKEWTPLTQQPSRTPAPESPTLASPYRSPPVRHYSSPTASSPWQQQQQQQESGGGSWDASSSTTAKEFVPGSGWTGVGGSSGSGGIASPQQQQQQQGLGWQQQRQQQQQQGLGWQQQQQQQQPQPTSTEIPELPLLLGGNAAEKTTNAATTVPAVLTAAPQRSLHSSLLLGGSNADIDDGLWRYYRTVALESQREMDPSDPRHKAVPPPFANAYPLDQDDNNTNNNNNTSSKTRSSFGYPTAVFRVVNREDGNLYCLRRVDNVRSVSHKIASAVTERWRTAMSSTTSLPVLEHPGLVRFYRVFVANRAVFFVHQYHAGARTLRERLYNNASPFFPEPLLWSCITQLVSAIRAVHTGNLACRTIQPNHILCSGGPQQQQIMSSASSSGEVMLRLRINCLGMVDALEFETRRQLLDLQREDMRDLGLVILSLATGTEITRSSDTVTLRQCDAFVRQNYSPELVNLVLSLLTPHNANTPTILDVSHAILAGHHALDEVDRSFAHADRMETALAAEYESGRALRLLLKLGFVNERPEFGVNRRWTESGDCYVLKLFRDYVFHQADGGGRPVMDLGHIVTALNKLDASDDEKIVLSSRDGKTLMVVSFADVARCLDSAFNELLSGSVPPGVLQY